MKDTETYHQSQSLSLQLRALLAADLPQVQHLQERVYPASLWESAEVLASKISAAPAGWASLAAVSGDTLCGYAIGYPWQSDRQPRWNCPLERYDNCDVLYLHDVAVLPSYAGNGIARRMVNRLMQQGREFGLQTAVLVAVEGAEAYWSRLGFRALQAPLADRSFGDGALLMQSELAGAGAFAPEHR